MERVDIVDENNHVISQATKIEAHKRGLLHRTIIAEVIDNKGKWILVRQAADRQDAGQYVSPVGGHIRMGESEIEALKRETLEEMGIAKFTCKYIGKKIFNRNILGRQENHYFILYEIYSDQPPKLNHESVNYRKFYKKELKTELKTNPQLFGDAFHFVINNFYFA